MLRKWRLRESSLKEAMGVSETSMFFVTQEYAKEDITYDKYIVKGIMSTYNK